MIVVDTNIISYLLLPTEHSAKADKLYQRDPDWAAPELWRSEFRNVLALYMRKKLLTLEAALQVQETAEDLFRDNEFTLPSSRILSLVNESDCSAYDCEFVALAQGLDVKLVTEDKQIIRNSPGLAVKL